MDAINEFHFPVGQRVVKLLADGDRIVMSMKEGKPFEPRTLETWVKICEEAAGKIVFDVGAYSGLFSILASQCGAIPYAFEPLTENKTRIQENSRLNSVRFPIAQALVCNHTGVADITVNPNVVGLTSGASMIRRNGVQRTLPSIRLDDMEVDDLYAIKIDVERAEPLVIAGATKTIRKHKPILIVEVLDDIRAESVKGLLPDYKIREKLDVRNWYMVPR